MIRLNLAFSLMISMYSFMTGRRGKPSVSEKNIGATANRFNLLMKF